MQPHALGRRLRMSRRMRGMAHQGPLRLAIVIVITELGSTLRSIKMSVLLPERCIRRSFARKKVKRKVFQLEELQKYKKCE